MVWIFLQKSLNRVISFFCVVRANRKCIRSRFSASVQKSEKRKYCISIFSGLVQKSVFYVVPRDKISLISPNIVNPIKCQRTFYLMIYLFKDKTNILQHGEKAIACKKVTLSFLVSSLRGWVVTRPILLYIFTYNKN